MAHKASDLWECSSPEGGTPTHRPQPAVKTFARSVAPLSSPQKIMLQGQRDVKTVAGDDFPTLQAVEKELDAGLSALTETLAEHDKQVMSQEESLLAITREAHKWRKRAAELEAELVSHRAESGDKIANAMREVDAVRKLHRVELDEARQGRHAAEIQFQKLVIDYDECRQQLVMARKQLAELEHQREEMGIAFSSLQQRLQHRDREVNQQQSASSQDHQLARQKLESLRGKFDGLERLCDDLRREKDDVEKQARQALLELHDLRSKKDNRALVDVQEVYEKEQQVLRLEEQLQSAHLNNARLLRLMAEVPELHDIIRFNEVTQDFVFVGYNSLLGEQDVPADALVPPRGLEEDISCRAAAAEARSGRPVTGGAFGVIAGVGGTRNSLLRSSARSSGALFAGVPNAMRHLHDAIRDENHALHRNGIKLSDAATSSSSTGAGVLPPPSNNLVECKSHERYYWIPRAALVEAQDFREAYFPRLSLKVFFPFLVRLNQIWRQKQSAMCRDRSKERSVSVRKTRSASLPSHRREDYEQETARRMELDMVAKELDSLRREVRLRVSSKVAQQLCKQYDTVARLQISKRVLLEQKLEDLSNLHNHTLADRAPETVTMQAHLRTLSDTARSLSHHIASKLIGASSDIRRFVASLEAAATRSAVMHNGVVSATVVRQLMDCIKDFASEVKTEAGVTTDSLRRIADAAERAATEVPPIGYVMEPRDDNGGQVMHKHGGSARVFAPRKAHSAGDLKEPFDDDDCAGQQRHRVHAYDDLVDDDVAERLASRKY